MTSKEMTVQEQAFITAFEGGSMPPGTFHHSDHVRLTWLYLHRYPVLDALARLIDGLKQFAHRAGRSELYHETITCAFFFLIHERMEKGAPDESWADFAGRNPDLLNQGKALLERYYRAETLASPLARKIFVLPDRVLAHHAPLPCAA